MPLVQRKYQTICLVFYYTNYQIFAILTQKDKAKNCPIMKKRGLLLNAFENVKRYFGVKSTLT